MKHSYMEVNDKSNGKIFYNKIRTYRKVKIYQKLLVLASKPNSFQECSPYPTVTAAAGIF